MLKVCQKRHSERLVLPLQRGLALTEMTNWCFSAWIKSRTKITLNLYNKKQWFTTNNNNWCEKLSGVRTGMEVYIKKYSTALHLTYWTVYTKYQWSLPTFSVLFVCFFVSFCFFVAIFRDMCSPFLQNSVFIMNPIPPLHFIVPKPYNHNTIYNWNRLTFHMSGPKVRLYQIWLSLPLIYNLHN